MGQAPDLMPPYLRSYFEANDLDQLLAIAEDEQILQVTEQQHHAFTIRFQDATITLSHRQAVSFVRGILWEYTLTGHRLRRFAAGQSKTS